MRPFGGLVAVLCALAFTLSGCGSTTSSSSKSAVPTAKPSQTVTQAPSLKERQKGRKAAPQKATSQSPSGTQAQSSTQRSQMCTTGELQARLAFGGGSGAGSAYPYLVLTNKGNRTCLERGYPGVSLQANGRQIGAAANRDTSVAPVSIQLKPGESAHSELQIVNAANIAPNACSQKQADSLLVFPPDQTQAISISTTDYVGCENMSSSIIRVRPLQPGAN